MYTLILIISLKTQFNHALDVQPIGQFRNEHVCTSLGEKIRYTLKEYNPDTAAYIICQYEKG
jgi:hypothetical protein